MKDVVMLTERRNQQGRKGPLMITLVSTLLLFIKESLRGVPRTL